jgi:hypothetical protein
VSSGVTDRAGDSVVSAAAAHAQPTVPGRCVGACHDILLDVETLGRTQVDAQLRRKDHARFEHGSSARLREGALVMQPWTVR